MRLRKQQRLALVILAVLLVGGAAGLVLAALQDKVAFFVTPTQVAEQALEPGRRFRLGGLVVDGSIKREADGTVRFAITDITPSSCRFEQAFSADGGKTWEVNWIATDTRVNQ